MGSINTEDEYKLKRETIQIEREELRMKIAEILQSNYDRLEREAEKIAPGFDYEKEAAELKAEEEAELAALEPEAEPAPAEEPLPEAEVTPSKYPREKKVYKTKAGRYILGDRNGRALAASVLMLALFAAYQAWDYLVPKTVGINYTTYEGVVDFDYRTLARTAGEVKRELAGNGGDFEPEMTINEDDILNMHEEIPVKGGMEIKIVEAMETTAKIAGEKQTIFMVPGTVKENLDLNSVAYDDDDEVKPALDKKVSEDTKITVNEIHYNVKEKTETVEAADKVILDPSLTSGVQETEEGNDGEGVFTYTTRYVNGKKKDTERELKEWITEPHDNVLRLGTSRTGNKGEYTVTKTFTANTTAYTAGSGARGAIGQTVHVGTCAVDPRYVKLRSEMWIEGYGYAYATDTGGAVKGNVVDLYMSSRGQCISWGRRNRTAYVIVPDTGDESE